VHDIYSYDYGGWGLYTDEGSTGIVMENNLVYRCKSGGFHQHYGKENIIRNNIFALGYQNQLQFTREEPHRSLTFERNIVLSDRGVLLGGSGSWRRANIAMDRNDYWDLRADTMLRFDGLSFREWRRIKDSHSIVADPMFRDPEAGDFGFRSLKTARRIGFVPFDYTQAGVYGSAAWRAKARLATEVTEAFSAAVEAREAYYRNGAPERGEQ
ncbi:MAG: right-handed parallel beta-helix repeat-containing protein, partial [Rikenella sp.]|nr:right-handed parallel beta-helix repeat-containing protein [Rikenella sp.]